jgi:hypothetical protein
MSLLRFLFCYFWLWRKIAFALWQTWSDDRVDRDFSYAPVANDMSGFGTLAVTNERGESNRHTKHYTQLAVSVIIGSALAAILLFPLAQSYTFLSPNWDWELSLFTNLVIILYFILYVFIVFALVLKVADDINKVREWLIEINKPGAPRGWALFDEIMKNKKLFEPVYMVIVVLLIFGTLLFQQYKQPIFSIVFIIFNIAIALIFFIYVLERLWQRLKNEKQGRQWMWGICALTIVISGVITLLLGWDDNRASMLGRLAVFLMISLMMLGVALLLLKSKQRQVKKSQDSDK